MEVGDSIMLRDWFSSSFPVPQCQCATEPMVLCVTLCIHCVYGADREPQDSDKFCCAIFWAPQKAGSTQWCVGLALKQAMDDQIINLILSHLHPDLLVSHLRLRSWETWAVCLPLPWCAKRGPGSY